MNSNPSYCGSEVNDEAEQVMELKKHAGVDDDQCERRTEDRQNPSRTRYSILQVSCAVLLVVVCVETTILGVTMGSRYKESDAEHDPEQPQALRSDPIVQAYQHSNLDIRLNPFTNDCPSEHCSRCTTRIQKPVVPIPSGMSCSNTKEQVELHLSTFGCDNTSYEWIVNNVDKHGRLECSENYIEISCCMLKTLLPAGYCNQGVLECDGHQYHEPTCRCSPGRKNPPHCQDLDEEPVVCRCFNTSIAFCGQETMWKCSDISRPPDWQACSLDLSNRQQQCLCEAPRYNDTSEDLKVCNLGSPRSLRNALNSGTFLQSSVFQILVVLTINKLLEIGVS